MMKLEMRYMVGRNLKRLRQRAGLTQDSLAPWPHDRVLLCAVFVR